MAETKDNLSAAFTGESRANRKYVFFAEKAEEEGHKQIARLFRAAADAETVHAKNHLKVMEGINTTAENLEEAIAGESDEFENMYPAFIEQGEKENQKDAVLSFKRANPVERIHHSLYAEALKALKGGDTLKEEVYYVCQICGNTVGSQASEICPICGAPKSMFKKID